MNELSVWLFFFRTDKFKVASPDLGDIQKVTIGHDNGGLLPEWNLGNVRTNLNSRLLYMLNFFYYAVDTS